MSRYEDMKGSAKPLLTAFVLGITNKRFIGDLVIPMIPVDIKEGNYPVAGLEGLSLEDTKNPYRTLAKGGDTKIDEAPYKCVPHAWSGTLDRREIDDAKRALGNAYTAKTRLDLEKRRISYVHSILAVRKEKEAADIIFGASYYHADNKLALTGTTCWSDKVNSDPVSNLRTGKDVVVDCALVDDEDLTLVLGPVSWRLLRDHPKVIALLGANKDRIITKKLAADLLGFKDIIVGSAIAKDADGATTKLWGDSAAIEYIPSKNEYAEGTPAKALRFQYKSYPKVIEHGNEVGSKLVEYHYYDQRSVSLINGYLITNTQA